MKDVARGHRVAGDLPRPVGPSGEDRADEAARPLDSSPPRWRSWLAQAVIFSVALFLVLSLFSALGRLIQGFFMTLYAP